MNEKEKSQRGSIKVCPWKIMTTKEVHTEIRTLASLERVTYEVTQLFTSFSSCAYSSCPFFDSLLGTCKRVDK